VFAVSGENLTEFLLADTFCRLGHSSGIVNT